jgi:hypothetical protein
MSIGEPPIPLMVKLVIELWAKSLYRMMQETACCVASFELEDDVSSTLLTARLVGEKLARTGRGTVSNRSWAEAQPAVQAQNFCRGGGQL